MAASSSGDALPIPLLGPPLDIIGHEAVEVPEATPMMEHEGHVKLDRMPGCDIVTHLLTLESKRAPPGHKWDLVFEDGAGALCSDTTEQVLFLDEWLDYNIYVRDGCQTIIRSDGSKAGSKSLVQ